MIKCICGYRDEEGVNVAGNKYRVKGTFGPFIRLKGDFSVDEQRLGTQAIVTLYVCPECGTVRCEGI